MIMHSNLRADSLLDTMLESWRWFTFIYHTMFYLMSRYPHFPTGVKGSIWFFGSIFRLHFSNPASISISVSGLHRLRMIHLSSHVVRNPCAQPRTFISTPLCQCPWTANCGAVAQRLPSFELSVSRNNTTSKRDFAFGRSNAKHARELDIMRLSES